MRLIAKWPSKHPEAAAASLAKQLEKAERDFTDIRNDTHVPEPGRFQSRDGLMVSRWWGTENPKWRIGYTERGLTLMVDFPDLKAVRQRRLSLLRWDTYVVNDRDREERWQKRVAEAVHLAGLNPYEAQYEWDIASDFATA